MVRTKSRATDETRIAQATGTANNPMSDEALRDEFLGNATPAIAAEQARRVGDMIGKLDSLGDVGDLVRACV